MWFYIEQFSHTQWSVTVHGQDVRQLQTCLPCCCDRHFSPCLHKQTCGDCNWNATDKFSPFTWDPICLTFKPHHHTKHLQTTNTHMSYGPLSLSHDGRCLHMNSDVVLVCFCVWTCISINEVSYSLGFVAIVFFINLIICKYVCTHPRINRVATSCSPPTSIFNVKKKQ